MFALLSNAFCATFLRRVFSFVKNKQSNQKARKHYTFITTINILLLVVFFACVQTNVCIVSF